MCRKVKCTNCNKWTWAGCGQHIESALAGVPVSFDIIEILFLRTFSKIKDAHARHRKRKQMVVRFHSI
jgi:hypothetical protein